MQNKAGGSGRAARAMTLPHFGLSDHVILMNEETTLVL